MKYLCPRDLRRGEMEEKMKKLLSLVLAMVMVCGLGSYLPSDVAAAENTMTFEKFIEAVKKRQWYI